MSVPESTERRSRDSAVASQEMGRTLASLEVAGEEGNARFVDGKVLPPPAGSMPPATPENTPGRLSARWEQWGLAIGAGLCWAFLALALVIPRVAPVEPWAAIALYVAAYIAGGTTATVNALRLLFTGRTISIDLLMITAAAGAAYLGHWEEGAILLGLFSTSGALEHYALGRTERAVKALMDLSPAVATVIADGAERVTPVEQLRLGETVLVRPGERVSVDGQVLAGETSVDQAAITGESVPVAKREGDAVFAGTINGHGAIYVRVDRLHQESTLAKIVQFVAQAQAQKSATQRFTDRFEGAYAIGVIIFALLVGAIPILFLQESADAAIYRAITLLVVASPCALVISTPAATLSALANAARNGVLFKGSADLEKIGETRIVAFDKTGTLTHGKPALTNVEPLGTWDAQTLLQLAASAEHFSEHHMARAMVAGAAERQIPLLEASSFRAIPGKGITAQVAGQEVLVGNAMLFADAGVAVPAAAGRLADELRDAGRTAVFAGNRQGVQGVLAVADTLRPDALTAIRDLKQLGISRIVVLTGDHQRLADAICTELGVDEVHGDMLPEEKLRFIEALEQEGPVTMVGDGVNDAPALAIASVGVAMGGAGTDVALETADVVLMGDDLRKLPYAIALSRRTRRTIRQNLAFALAVIAVLVTATLTRGIPLPLGVIGHEGSTIIVVLLGLRLLIWRRDSRQPVTVA
ncbi:MAG: heavy metal translocating P-type ATPase [Chloroflexota bacterium]|nr:heavy metal translocating P-type ATPase [Chloroflexota bacterium]